jgi:thiol-disulfide isomerase/thioredoxin
MNRRLAGIALGVALVAVACSGGDGTATDAASGESTSVAVEVQGDPIPTIPFERFNGESATLASYAGRPLVVNFWASWCPSCVSEMSAAFLPAQQALGDQVAFLGLNIADERDQAQELAAETGVLFDLAEDTTGALYTELGGLGMPFTVYISADGRVLDVHNGPLTQDQLVDQITRNLLS